MSTLDTLLHRNSHPRLTEPGPDADQLQTILQAALRAPDHGRLRPWRFVVISGDRRAALGECFQRSLQHGTRQQDALDKQGSVCTKTMF